MPRTRLPLPLIGVLLVACGAHDDEAPVHPDPAPRCRRLQDRMPRLLAALDAGGARRLKASLEEALDEAAAGRLVEIAMALVRALPEDLEWTERAPGGLPVELLGNMLRGVARSPDLDALGRTLGPVLDQCNLAPVLHAGAAILRDPRAPDVLAALSASAQDRAAITSLRAALLATPDQRRGWPHLAAPLICQLRDTTNELEALRQFLVPLLGERAKQPPLSEAVDVPKHYLSKIMRRLVVAGLVQSQKGHGGGFSLARSRDKIKYTDILAAVDEAPYAGVCAFGWGACDPDAPCPLHPSWSVLSDQICDWADTHTLADVSRDPAAAARRLRFASKKR